MFLCYKSMEPLKLCVNSVSKPVSKDYNTTTFFADYLGVLYEVSKRLSDDIVEWNGSFYSECISDFPGSQG